MMEKIKWYFVNVAVKKYAPIGVMAILAALGTFLAAHAGMLEQYGITYGDWPFSWPKGQIPSGKCILVELDTVSKAAIGFIISLVAIAMRATEHHTIEKITPPIPIEGGTRAGDPPPSSKEAV